MAAALLAQRNAAAAGPGIVDAHVHLWSPDTHKYPLAPGFTAKDLWSPGYTAEQLRSHSDPAGVSRINLVQMTWYGLDHSYILDLIAKDPKRYCGTGIVPAISDVSGPSPDQTMIELSKRGVVAFRVRGKSTRPQLPEMARWMEHPNYDKMFAAGAAHNLALSFLMGPSDLPELDRMCARFPDTPVIIDHFCLIGRQGRFDEDEVAALTAMARHKRVMVKFGGFYALGAKRPPYTDMLPLIRRLVEAFGPNRCMWESDAPKQTDAPHTYEAALAVIREHAGFLSASDRNWILNGTAEALFFKR